MYVGLEITLSRYLPDINRLTAITWAIRFKSMPKRSAHLLLPWALMGRRKKNGNVLFFCPRCARALNYTHTPHATAHTSSSLCLSFHVHPTPVHQRGAEAGAIYSTTSSPTPRDEERQEMFPPILLGRGSFRKSVQSGGPRLRDP